MTDINPMWRIKSLTEQFGPCGIGWYYEIKDRWLETCMAKDEITANVNINLYVKVDGEWSKPIPGIGGSMLVASERNGLYVNDECYKMALTDAISVACKMFTGRAITQNTTTPKEIITHLNYLWTTREIKLPRVVLNAESILLICLSSIMLHHLKKCRKSSLMMRSTC